MDTELFSYLTAKSEGPILKQLNPRDIDQHIEQLERWDNRRKKKIRKKGEKEKGSCVKLAS